MAGLEQLGTDEWRAVVVGYRDALRAHQERLNRLNVYPVPDGDTGTNMALTLESVVVEIDGADDLPTLFKGISHGSLMGARGNSGVILSQILRGLTEHLRSAVVIDGASVAGALTAASAAADGAVMRPVEGTILTVVRESARAAEQAASGGGGLCQVLDAAAAAARTTLDRTPELLPVLAEAGVVDAGGAGFVLLLDALLHVVDGREIPEAGEVAGLTPAAAGLPGGGAPTAGPAGAGGHGEGGADLRYEVMFLLEADDDAVPAMKEAWAALGDSIVVVGGEGLWNCHVHTDDAGAAIEAGIEAGRPRRIQITDLRDQVEEQRWVRHGLGPVEPAGPGAGAPATASGVVAVAAGEGLAGIFRSMGAGEVVAGGPSMNPSTAELLAAVERVPADSVVILPNDRNVVAVAQRVAELTTKPVRVVPTASVPEGLAAMVGFEAGDEPGDNARAMAEAAAAVRAGEVTWAVRDATTPVGPVAEGDHLGLAGGRIVAAGSDPAEVACRVLDALVDDGIELVTVFEGTRATSDDTARITAWLGEHHPGIALEVHAGGQPLASYLFSAE